MHYNKWEPILYRALSIASLALGVPILIVIVYSFGG